MKKLAALMAGVALAALAGCGGGSKSSPAGPPVSGTTALTVFATDGPSEDNAHVWMEIHKVELEDAAGRVHTVFEDNVGRNIDLKSLRDASGPRFAFLNRASVPAGTYTAARVTTGATVNMFPNGATAGQAKTLAPSVPRDNRGWGVVRFALSTPKHLEPGDDRIVIDFDLSAFTVAGGTVTPSIKEGVQTGLQSIIRHENEDYEGVVSALAGTAPNLSFTLTMPTGSSFGVATGAGTAIFNSNAAPNPVLANGKRVEVRGSFDLTANRLKAAEVKIKVGAAGAEDPHEARGAVSAINAAAGTFKVATTAVEGFLPAQSTISVTTTATTAFRSDAGLPLTKAEFFAQLAASALAEVEGTYNAATNTLAAVSAKLEDEDVPGQINVPHAVDATGTASAINAATGQFSLAQLTAWEGFVPPAGALSVVTGATTQFKNAANATVTKAAFFTALAASPKVKVEGNFSGSAITATELKLLVAPPPTGTTTLSVFQTDTPADDNAQVWMEIHKVELEDAAGHMHTVFEDNLGRQSDLKQLHDAAGPRFEFLNRASVPAGTYTAVRVKAEDRVTLFPNGATTGQSATMAASVPRDNQGLGEIRHVFPAPKHLEPGDDRLVVDFDLANFTITGGQVTPRIKEGSHTGLDDAGRHEVEDYEGVISGMGGSAPNVSFTLTMATGVAFPVATGSGTVIFNSDLTPNPVLANGKRVEARGTFDLATRRLQAVEVKIKTGAAGEDPHEGRGAVSAINAAAGTFKVGAGAVEGFLPTQTTINVVTTANTTFRSDDGLPLLKADFFTQLATSPLVEVEGVYSAATNTLTAVSAKLEDEALPSHFSAAHTVEAIGTASGIDAAAGRFNMGQLTKWEGFMAPAGTFAVVTGATEFKDLANDTVSKAAFFAALATNTKVKVEGNFGSGGTVTATQLKLQ